jgi:hypothetical protein
MKAALTNEARITDEVEKRQIAEHFLTGFRNRATDIDGANDVLP